MNEVKDIRKQIQLRLEEKRKLSKAQNGAFILSLVVSGLIMLTFLRVSFLFNDKSISLPVAFIASLVLLGILVWVMSKAKLSLRQDELDTATQYVKVALVISVTLTLMLVLGVSVLVDELKTLHRFSFGAFIVFLAFYTLNLLFTIAGFVSVLRKLSAFEIHSQNMSEINRLYIVSMFLFSSLSVFILLTHL